MGGRVVFFLDVLDKIHFLALFSFERLPEFIGSWPLHSSKPAVALL